MSLNIDGVRALLAEIQRYAEKNDHEAAHDAEDDLWREVLKTIAESGDLPDIDPAALAREALKSADIEFERWTA